MKLEELYKKELEKRAKEMDFWSEQYNELTSKYIEKDDATGISRLAFEKFDEKDKQNYEDISNITRKIALKNAMFYEYIRRNSGLDFSHLISTISVEDELRKMHNDYIQVLTDSISILKSDEPTKSYAEIMGQQFEITNLKELKPNEQKEAYFDLITKSMELNGYTNDQIEEAIHNLAVEMGGKEITAHKSV